MYVCRYGRQPLNDVEEWEPATLAWFSKDLGYWVRQEAGKPVEEQ